MDVATELTYVERSDTRPGFYNYQPPEGAPDPTPTTRRHDMVIRDARHRIDQLQLDSEGLAIVELETAVKDLYDGAQVRSVYYPEVESLVMAHTGAARVIAFDHNVRNRALAETRSHVQKPVTFVHNDYTHGSGPQRVKDIVGGRDADTLIEGRFSVVNVWKPIVGPVQRSPLAVCDASSMGADDFIETDLLYPDRKGEIYSVAHRDSHQWFYVSDMLDTEAMLLKCYDSELFGVARFTAHSAFEIPGTDEAPPRESIEVRTLVFY